MAKTYTLQITAYTSETIPMGRLAEYMRHLAMILGHAHAVHFDDLKPGSTRLVSRIDKEYVPKVEAAIGALAVGDGAPEQVKAREGIDQLLADDDAIALLYEGDDPGASVIEFCEAATPQPAQYGPITQEDSLDGILIGVGCVDKTIHIHLRNGDIEYSNIDTSRAIARRLGKCLFRPIRVFGTAIWIRDEGGTWRLKRFTIESFKVLRSGTLRDVVGELRALGSSGWADLEDPFEALRQLRDEGAGPH